METKKQNQFVLVHGAGHGAWSWYKVKTELEAAGHRVIAMDLAASGINMTRVEEIQTLKDYSKPLLEVMDSLASDEKVVLVAHSMGGIPASLAAEIFPSKVAAIVFLSSSMPDTKNPPAYAFEKWLESTPTEEFLDSVFGSYETLDRRTIQTVLFGPKFLAEKVYQLSPVEDLELAKTLMRVSPLITSNLAGTRSFTEEGYGSVTRVYVICGADNIIPVEYQRWVISNFPPQEVREIEDADHMSMFSKTRELCAHLLDIADKYA